MKALLDIDRFHEIFETLSRNRSRTLLTGFGVFWGIFMLLSLMGGGQGLKAILSKEFEGFATNSGFVVAGETSLPYKGFKSGRTYSLTLGDVEKVRAAIPEIEVITGSVSRWGTTAVYGDHSTNCVTRGVRPEYASIEEPRLQYGRYLNEVDIYQERKVCVLGKRVYRQLFPEGGDPCGQYIKADGIYYQVVGVDLNAGNVSINGSVDRAVTVPITVLQRMYNWGDQLAVIGMTAKPGYKIKDILAKVRDILAKRHLFDPDDRKALFEINTEEMFSIVDNLFKGINLLIWLVGFGTLLAAAIGVSNIMMVTVRERTTEIGIRRAIGATPRMILSQIMLESVILTTAFGSLGIIFAVLVLSGADIAATRAAEIAGGFQVSFGSAVLALVILTVLGLLAGLPPAQRAMRIKPVDAMRDE